MTEDRRLARVLLDVVQHPVVHFVRHWNWKAATASSILRAAIFFVMNVPAGLDAGLRAMLTELVFRAIASGALGSLTQSLRRAEPAWAAMAAAVLILPTVGHGLEYAVHYAAGTPKLSASIAASVAFTCVTTAFNLFIMRRNVLIVGEGQRSFREDLRQLPQLSVDFISQGWRSCRAGARALSGRRSAPTL